jgi:hypothetical protein
MQDRSSRRTRAGFVLIAFITIAVMGLSCASVNIKRVRRDDFKTEGFRFYLPRPYVVVNKPFAVGGDVLFVQGTLDENNRVIRLDPASLPDEVRSLFSTGADNQLSISTGQVLPPGTRSANRARAESTGGGGSNDGSNGSVTAATPATVVIGDADADKWLTGSKVEPAPIVKGVDAFDVTGVLTKDAPFQDGLKEEKAGFVPLNADGTPQPAKFVAFKDQKSTSPTSPFKAGTGGTYAARGTRAEVSAGGTFVVGVSFTGKKTGESEEKKYLVHRGASSAVQVFGGKAADAKDDAGKKEEPKKEKEAEQEYNEISKALLATSGDPGTNPLTELKNAPFDILLLPDFDEQYAMRITAGLGQAQAAIGMENGWMVERASMAIDNRELGKFVFRQIDKFTDLARDVAALSAGLILPPSTQPADVSPESTAKTEVPRTVLLRLSYFLEAQPGVYPLLKPWEKNTDPTITADEKAGRAYVMVPFRPYTVVAYNVRRQMVLEMIDVTPQPAATDANTRSTGIKADRQKINSENGAGAVIDAVIKEAKLEYAVKGQANLNDGGKLSFIANFTGTNPAKRLTRKDLGAKVLEKFDEKARKQFSGLKADAKLAETVDVLGEDDQFLP